MKKTFGKQAMRIMAAALVMVLLMVSMASGEQSAWDCPECGRTGNLWNYCGNCAHPAPWTKEEGFDEEKAYEAVLKQLEEIEGKIGSLNDYISFTESDITNINENISSITLVGRYISGLHLCIIEFNINISSPIAHNSTLFTLPNNVNTALMSVSTTISSVNATSIIGQAVTNGGSRSIIAYGSLNAGNYIRGSFVIPTY